MERFTELLNMNLVTQEWFALSLIDNGPVVFNKTNLKAFTKWSLNFNQFHF